jgi:hypothetical protein
MKIYYNENNSKKVKLKTKSKPIPKSKQLINLNIYDITILINSYNPDKNDLLKSINSCLQQIGVYVFIIIITIENDITIPIYDQYLKKMIILN